MISGLNSNHQRSLLAGFHHIDELLADVEAAANASASPFGTRFDDLSPVERQVVLDSVASIRQRMVSAVQAIGMSLPPPRTAASWAIQTGLSFARITVQEMDPKRLEGYGTVGPQAAALLERLNADLERSMTRLITYLVRGAGKDLSGRLDRLERAPVDLSEVRGLEEIIAEHGLVEFQSSLEALVERLETTTFEIALFGRVSSGKSSLLNSILGFAALPVGVTPVTAVPTRVRWGEVARAEIGFAEAPSETIALPRLEEFVSERLNPENRKHVRRAVVEVPVEFLRRGVVFVDTPGIGSLATSGARESYAYLPRCDLGVLLVDAGSVPGRDEIELLRLLYESGIPPMLVISKADLLSEADRARMKSYVESEVTKRLGTSLRVQFVSTVGKDEELAHSWFHREIEPLISRSEDHAAASARRKLALLKEAVAAALRSEANADGRDPAAAGGSLERVEALALEAEAAIAEASSGMRRLADRCRALAGPTIQSAAAEIVRRAGEKEATVAASIVKQAISDTVAEIRSEASNLLVAARDRLRDLLREMAEQIGKGSSDVEGIAVDLLSLPSIPVPAAVEELDLRGRFRLFGSGARAIARRISEEAGPALQTAYTSFGSSLLRAGERALSILAERFAAQSEPYRAQARRAGRSV